MAQLIINIPDNQVDRIKAAFISSLKEEDAVDLANPTNAEIASKVKSYMIEATKQFVNRFEKNKAIESIDFVDIEIG